MRKSFYIYISVSVILFSSASPWEGAATVAPAGELPQTGFFIATNSYPKNSVVDITNLETDKTTRVIVASTLDSPGLLAIVSREAAELIGMKAGIINRIRIVQPFEPIAYLRFKESLDTGIPGYDSGNVITEERYDTYVPPVVVEYERTEPVASGITGPSYTLEPEWQNREIVDVPFNMIVPPVTQTPAEEIKEPEHIAEDELVEEIEPEYFVEEEPAKEIEPEYFVEEEPAKEIEPVYIAEDEPVKEEEIVEESVYFAEEPVGDIIEKTEIVEVTPSTEMKEYELAAAGERPPEGTIYGIDPADIIPGINRPPQTSDPVIVSTPVVPVIPIIPIVPIVPIVPVIPENLSSVPRLSQGGYYVQIAALSSPDLFETTVNGIDRRYPIVLDDKNNVYRILLGPLNQGESAAVLQRFKSIGYNDAFVRLER